MLKIIIVLLVFSSVGLLISQLLPFIMNFYFRTQKKKFDNTAKKLSTMFLEVGTEGPFYLLVILAPVILGLAGFIFLHNFLGLIVGAVFGFVLPSLATQRLEKMRKRKFQQQLVDTIMLLSASLKSGLSILQAIEVVIEEMPAPTNQEFKLVLNAIKVGVTIEESLERLKERMYSEELNMLITSILVSRETGGDLSRIFERVVNSIRQKTKVSQQLSNLTLQARWQGMIMMALPLVFSFGIYQMNSKYFSIMLNSETGRMLLIYGVISQIVGMVIIRRFSKLGD
jgi:tight adherence protein B